MIASKIKYLVDEGLYIILLKIIYLVDEGLYMFDP